MQPSLYDASIPGYRDGLRGLLGILDKTAAHLGGRDESELLGQSLAERLFPLGRQVIAACGHAEKDPALAAGIDPPRAIDGPTLSIVALRRRVVAALEFLLAVEPERLNGGADREIPHGGHLMKASEYILRHSLPHFYFHLTIVYVTLRQNGVPIGKPDFLGTAQPGAVAA
ncbi:MAG: DUF1993 domain-containing protein [Bauldia sp.]|nr:DUF1993 domain-containing protein [Bauldia sp.]MCW5718174.1 DUF1993 domain-containing protein [Bauldia sp.]